MKNKITLRILSKNPIKYVAETSIAGMYFSGTRSTINSAYLELSKDIKIGALRIFEKNIKETKSIMKQLKSFTKK